MPSSMVARHAGPHGVSLLAALALLCIAFPCSMSSEGSQQVITVHPVSVVAALGSYATFNCSVANTVALKWEINTNELDPTSNVAIQRQISTSGSIREGNIISSSLAVRAIKINDGIRVNCLGSMEDFSDPLRSMVANLTVYGPPEPPQNLSALPRGPLRLYISWTPSKSFSGVRIVYIVNVSVKNSSEHFQSGELVETSYTFDTDDPSCNYYTISVIAVNDAGVSNYTQVDNVAVPTVPTLPVPDVEYSGELESGKFRCQFTVTPADACSAYPVTQYTLTVTRNSTAGEPFHMSPNTVLFAIVLPENANYTYTAEAHNAIGTAAYIPGAFFTTDVQDPQITLQGKAATVECQYVTGSEALGCFIELIIPDGSMYMLASSSRDASKEEITTVLPVHCYDIYVYDWESDGTRGDLPIPVSWAVWNDSCLIDTTELPEPNGDDGLVTVAAAAGSAGIVLLMVMVVTVMIFILWMRKRPQHSAPHLLNEGTATKSAGFQDSDKANQGQPIYDIIQLDAASPKTGSRNVLLTHVTNPAIATDCLPPTLELVEYATINKTFSSAPSATEYSSLDRSSHPLPITNPTEASTQLPSLQERTQAHSLIPQQQEHFYHVLECSTLPQARQPAEQPEFQESPPSPLFSEQEHIYHVLECSTPPQAQPAEQPEYQEISETTRPLAISITNPLERSKYLNTATDV